TVKVEIIRDGKASVLTLRVAKKKGDDEVVAATEDVMEDTIGLSVKDISPEIARKLRIKGTKGVFIDSVKHGSPAAMAGLRRGDVISRVNKSEIKGIEDYQRAVKAARKEGLIRFLVYRGGNRFYVAMRLK
ncbi:MAG: PDZ domain-containing protein, partial [Deltaproteobacteria bacterium]|nr:PDZ domain-containing protein [Deltaproteobacteria bacterium]